MGLLGNFMQAVGDTAGTAADLEMKRFLAEIEKERQISLAKAQSEIRVAENQTLTDQKIKNMPAVTAAENAAAKSRTTSALETSEELSPRTNKLAVSNKMATDYSPEILTAEREKKIGDKKADLDFNTQNVEQIASNARKVAQAQHIVDPSYTMVPNQDGTVLMVNTRNPKADAIVLKDAKGEPIVRKDPEELKAATAIYNQANSEHRTATLEYKDALKLATESGNQVEVDKVKAEFAAKSKSYEEKVASAMSVMLKKAGDGKTGPKPDPAAFDKDAKPAAKTDSGSATTTRVSPTATADDVAKRERAVAERKAKEDEEKEKRRKEREKREAEIDAFNKGFAGNRR